MWRPLVSFWKSLKVISSLFPLSPVLWHSGWMQEWKNECFTSIHDLSFSVPEQSSRDLHPSVFSPVRFLSGCLLFLHWLLNGWSSGVLPTVSLMLYLSFVLLHQWLYYVTSSTCWLTCHDPQVCEANTLHICQHRNQTKVLKNQGTPVIQSDSTNHCNAGSPGPGVGWCPLRVIFGFSWEPAEGNWRTLENRKQLDQHPAWQRGRGHTTQADICGNYNPPVCVSPHKQASIFLVSLRLISNHTHVSSLNSFKKNLSGFHLIVHSVNLNCSLQSITFYYAIFINCLIILIQNLEGSWEQEYCIPGLECWPAWTFFSLPHSLVETRCECTGWHRSVLLN